MSLFTTPETHAANSPVTWRVAKVRTGLWALLTADGDAQNAGDRLQTYPTKQQALEGRHSGFHYDLWHKEQRWYAGATIAGWKSYAECKAEQERDAERMAARIAAKALEGAL